MVIWYKSWEYTCCALIKSVDGNHSELEYYFPNNAYFHIPFGIANEYNKETWYKIFKYDDVLMMLT